MATLATFTEAAQYASSDYWRHILLDAGDGRLPMFYSFRDGVLTFRGKRRNAKVERLICPRDPPLLAAAVQQFLRQTGGIMSSEDRYQYAHAQEDVVPTKWNQVKSALQQRLMIDQFARRCCNEHGLPEHAHAELVRTVQLGLLLGAFSEVHLDAEGNISAIDGLLYDEAAKQYYFHKPKSKQRKAVEVDRVYDADSTTSYDAIWVKPWTRLLRLLRVSADVGSTPQSAMPSTPCGAPY